MWILSIWCSYYTERKAQVKNTLMQVFKPGAPEGQRAPGFLKLLVSLKLICMYVCVGSQCY